MTYTSGYQNPEFSNGFSTSPFNSDGSKFNGTEFYKPGYSDIWKNFAPKETTKEAASEPAADKNESIANAINAVSKGLAWQNMRNQSDGSSGLQSTGGGVQQSGDLTFAYPMLTQETKTTAGRSSSGLGSALGTAAGIGLSIAFPAMAPAVAAALPGLGGALGGAAENKWG